MKELCRVTLERAYLFLDGELLSEEERREIQDHLEYCRPCYERFGLEREVTLLLSRLRGCSRCPQTLKSRILILLQEE